MSKGTILLTGLNGYIAGPAAEAFLKAGYKVRGTARSAASTKPVLDALSQYSDSIEVVEVPDITVAGAFDEAVKGVTHIAHLASPVSASFDDPEAVIHQATTGAIRVLESAAKVPQGSIKTVVIMSSVAAIHSKPDPSDPAITTTTTSPPVRIFSEADWNTTAEDQVKKLGKDAGFAVYEASKAAAERAVWKWRDENRPSFAITAVNPNFVAGPPLVVPPSKEKIPVTTSAICSVFVGNPLEAAAISSKLPGLQDSYVDVRDVARVFLWALENPEKANGERYLLSAWYVPPQSVADILREKYPDRKDVIEEGTPGDGYMPDWTYPEHVRDRFDGSKAIKATGVDYIPWDKTVVDTVEKLKVLL